MTVMTIGTKSVLYGAHCFFLHPWFVAWAWWKLHGMRTVEWWTSFEGLDGERVPATKPVRTSLLDWRLWLAFFVHDLGYVGKPNMDGEEGEQHPLLGARIMFRVTGLTPWHHFVLYHSRYFAKRNGAQFSPLCVADKLAGALTPAWLYLPMVRATGEIREYMAPAQYRARSNEALSEAERRELTSGDQRRWCAAFQAYMRRWVEEHRDGRADRWTNSDAKRATVNAEGVWQ